MSTKAEIEVTVDQVAGLFTRFDSLKRSQARQFFTQFKDFASRFKTVRKAADAAWHREAPDFNIYRFLSYERQEEFHSRLLQYLLDPAETHAQGHLFLKTFLQALHRKYPDLTLPKPPFDKGTWQIRREVIFGEGRLDIVIKNSMLHSLFVIENKVDAGECADQIKRYGKFLRKYEKDFPDQALLFLTLDGSRSTSAGDTRYYPVSYHHVIRDWLKNVLPRVEALTVRETVRQYLALIQEL